MKRTEAETIFAKVLLNENVKHQDLCEAISVAVTDMHTMAEVEEIVRQERGKKDGRNTI